LSASLSHFKNYLAPTSPFPLGIEVDRAEGLYIYDVHGKAYLDLISGIAVSNLGHGHPKVKEAIKAQVDKHLHVMVYGEYAQSSLNDLAEKLLEKLPANLTSCYFTNSGAEAIEGALKLAKRYTGRSELIAFRGAYHGSTHGALSVSGNETKKRAFRPLLPQVQFLNFNREEELSRINEKTAAVIVEPIQGDAGVRIPDPNFLPALRKRCNEVGALLIFDEIQTGIGRTGTLFAFEQFGVAPDILCSAKALGGGLPLGTFIASREMMQCFTEKPMLGHITTFGGNPVSCSAALATLQVIEEEQLLAKVEEKGRLFEQLLKHHRIVEVRRRGLFFAFEFQTAEEVQEVVQFCLSKGVICFWFLSCPNSFRIAPPLNISFKEIEDACAIIQEALEQLA
jgi:acetylornithine/succinyldiaminopimelate/putrescine aminotransferase